MELREEVGVSPEQATLRGIGVPLLVEDLETDQRWLVFTFLFPLRDRPQVRPDWESAAWKWVRSEDIAELDTVPGLAAALARVWPPWGSDGFWREMEQIALNTTQGATDLALRGLKTPARLPREARHRGLRAFAALHPSMGVFPHLAARGLRQRISPAGLAQELGAATAASADRAAHTLRGCRLLLTHSASRACREALISWGTDGRQVVVTESRPKREGVRLPRELAAAGLCVRLIGDAEMGLFVPQCDAG